MSLFQTRGQRRRVAAPAVHFRRQAVASHRGARRSAAAGGCCSDKRCHEVKVTRTRPGPLTRTQALRYGTGPAGPLSRHTHDTRSTQGRRPFARRHNDYVYLLQSHNRGAQLHSVLSLSGVYTTFLCEKASLRAVSSESCTPIHIHASL